MLMAIASCSARGSWPWSAAPVAGVAGAGGEGGVPPGPSATAGRELISRPPARSPVARRGLRTIDSYPLGRSAAHRSTQAIFVRHDGGGPAGGRRARGALPREPRRGSRARPAAQGAGLARGEAPLGARRGGARGRPRGVVRGPGRRAGISRGAGAPGPGARAGAEAGGRGRGRRRAPGLGAGRPGDAPGVGPPRRGARRRAPPGAERGRQPGDPARRRSGARRSSRRGSPTP